MEQKQAIIGVDEVGMGCLAGPVVVCAVLIPQNLHKKYKIGDLGVRDSKLMTPKQRETTAKLIKKLNLKYQISLCYPKTIDKINIYQASRKAMRRAIKKVQSVNLKMKHDSSKLKILIDGNKKIQNLNLPQQAIIHGDRKVFAIACASILAKVYRDRMMRTYAKKYPHYGFEHHKGYGTKHHMAMLAKHGPSVIHRRSFAPIRQSS